MLLTIGENNYNDYSSNTENKIFLFSKYFEQEKSNKIKKRKRLKEEIN